jgi:PLP dependent protein
MPTVHIDDIEIRIQDACIQAGRRRDDVTLVAVTKTQPPEIINEAIIQGLIDVGENRVQEYIAKRDALLPHRFHMIGHLQKNKVRHIVGSVDLIHSVDSVGLAMEISKRSLQRQVVTDILLEVNTSSETSKQGFSPEELENATAAILELPALQLRGLMTVAAFDVPEAVRPSFRMLKQLRDSLRHTMQDENIYELSMGMTNDFHIAIEEGATIIRIGSAIFGPRA